MVDGPNGIRRSHSKICRKRNWQYKDGVYKDENNELWSWWWYLNDNKEEEGYYIDGKKKVLGFPGLKQELKVAKGHFQK